MKAIHKLHDIHIAVQSQKFFFCGMVDRSINHESRTISFFEDDALISPDCLLARVVNQVSAAKRRIILSVFSPDIAAMFEGDTDSEFEANDEELFGEDFDSTNSNEGATSEEGLRKLFSSNPRKIKHIGFA